MSGGTRFAIVVRPGRCRYGKCRNQKIAAGTRVTIHDGRWYHQECWRRLNTTPPDHLELTRATPTERLALALDAADQAARAARLPARKRTRLRLDAYRAAVHAETRRTVAFYGLENGPADAPHLGSK